MIFTQTLISPELTIIWDTSVKSKGTPSSGAAGAACARYVLTL